MTHPASPHVAPAASRDFRRHRRGDERVRLLGAEVDLVRPEEVLHQAARAVTLGRPLLVANHNLHSLHLLGREPRLQAFFDAADLVEVDSTPLLWWARLVHGRGRRFHRCTYLDWRELFWGRAAAEGWTVFLLGAAPGVAERAAAAVRRDWPGVRMVTHHGHFDARPGSAEARAVLAAVQAARPQALLVAMGMPRQELWVLDHLAALPTCAVFTVGGALDYEAGVQRPAPRWLGPLGLEWLYRLLRDPRRLARRYLLEPWSLLPAAAADLRQAVGLRKRRGNR